MDVGFQTLFRWQTFIYFDKIFFVFLSLEHVLPNGMVNPDFRAKAFMLIFFLLIQLSLKYIRSSDSIKDTLAYLIVTLHEIGEIKSNDDIYDNNNNV